MPYRTTPLITGEYYHVFNRGVAKMNVFTNAHDYQRFLRTMSYYSIEGDKPRLSVFNPLLHKIATTQKIVSFSTYCLMPNHFHFLIKQEKEGGISEFISKLLNSYTKYFNTKYMRVGPLFQGQFKAVRIETDEHFLHVHRYIHLNPLVAYLVKNLDSYKWSSYHEYSNSTSGICQKEIILSKFPRTELYKKFLLDQEDYAKNLATIYHQLIDFEEYLKP